MTVREDMEPAGEPVTTSYEDRAQLEWEARAGRGAAAAAFGAALLPLIGTIISATSIGDVGDDTAAFLLSVDENSAGVLAGALVNALGTLLLPVALVYLYRATLARRPEAPTFARVLAIAAAAGLAVLLVVQQVFLLDVAADFVSGGDGSEEAADDLIEDSGVTVTTFIEAGLRVALGAAIIIIALNAMRAGLLGRFMGIMGIGVGIFYAIPILVDPILIQLFWGVALGFLFLGRWPGGRRGPAWERVEAIPWPTAADRLVAQREAAQADEGSGGERQRGPGPGPAREREGSSGEAPAPRPASRKRRRGR